MKNRPSLLSARCRLIDKLHNHQCHGSSNFRCRLLDVQKKKAHTQLAARVDFAIWRFLVVEVRIIGVQEICACMHMQRLQGLGLSLSLSLSTRSPNSFGQGGSVFFPFSFCHHKGRRFSKSATAFVHKGINHLKPRFFFPFDIGHSSSTMGLLWSSLLALVEDITPCPKPPSLPSILLSITQVLLNIV